MKKVTKGAKKGQDDRNIGPILRQINGWNCSLILDPTLKREFLLNGLGWKPEWILSVEQNFKSSILFYKVAVAAATRELCY
jgi:hypothetical protein